jgi:hypothetical protein
MRSKLAISAVVAASLFGATAIASAQTQTQPMSPGASGEGNAGTSSTTAPGKMKSNNMKQGTTTGAAGPQGMKPGSVDESKPGGRSTARNPAD